MSVFDFYLCSSFIGILFESTLPQASFEIGVAVALLILIVIIALRISTKDDKKVKAYKLLLQYAYLIFCFQMFPLIVSYLVLPYNSDGIFLSLKLLCSKTFLFIKYYSLM